MRPYLFGIVLVLALSQSSFAPAITTFTKSELLGRVEPSAHGDFKDIRTRFAARDGMYLRKEAYKAFRQMWRAAKNDGVNLTIISAFRSHQHQHQIWQRKWALKTGAPGQRVKAIMQYSSMPGISRHHWGTDIDVNALNNAYFEEGQGLRAYQWLQKHAPQYGYFQPYTAYNGFRDRGYREEKWHWSYYPTASLLQRAYALMIDYEDIKGFEGAEWADSLQVIEHFVMGIEVPQYFLKNGNLY